MFVLAMLAPDLGVFHRKAHVVSFKESITWTVVWVALALFRMITLDNWSDLFSAARADAPISAVLYFVSFILLGTMIMLNLFIGIIMNSMTRMRSDRSSSRSSSSRI